MGTSSQWLLPLLCSCPELADILPACNDISATQANPTANTVKAVWRLLNYLSTHPDHPVTYTACDMILKVYSDASYSSRPGSISIAGGCHYCGNKLDDTINGTLHSISCRIPTVCGAVSEAEYAALYINGTAAAWDRAVLASLGYPQPPTVLITSSPPSLLEAGNLRHLSMPRNTLD